ncbi:hypothetical protein HDV00_011542 [Rhizophlyctis rosea]|nr:hypothetical protein HDV00_011542 [Rhizophlyctis rosea]
MRSFIILSAVVLQTLICQARPQQTPNDPCLSAAQDFEANLPTACPLASSKYNGWNTMDNGLFTEAANLLATTGLKDFCPNVNTCLTYMQKTNDILKACADVKTNFMVNGYPVYSNPNITIATYAELANQTATASADTIQKTLCSIDSNGAYCYPTTTAAIPAYILGNTTAPCTVSPTCWRAYDQFHTMPDMVMRIGERWSHTMYLDGTGTKVASLIESGAFCSSKTAPAGGATASPGSGSAVNFGGIVAGVIVAFVVVGAVVVVVIKRKKSAVWWRSSKPNVPGYPSQ